MSQVITIDDLQSYMIGKTLDPGLGQQIVDGVNGWVETRTGRMWGTTVQVTERYSWTRNLWLRHPDIVSVDQIQLGWPNQTQTTLTSNSYFFDPLGRITLPWQYQNYSISNGGSLLYNDFMAVTYTYGNPTVPDDLFMAAVSIASGWYNFSANGSQDVVAANIGSYHLQFSGSVRAAASNPNPAKSTADANWTVIDSYRMKRV